MTLREIEKVQIVDDDPDSRQVYGYVVVDASLQPIVETEPLGSLEEYLSRTMTADAAICDYTLNVRSYASFTGAELCARWYERHFPALLCTRYEKAQIERIRPFRRRIPVLLKPSELNPDTLLKGFEECLSELRGDFAPARRPWRTQVHFLTKDPDSRDTFFVELPGWEGKEILKVRTDTLPPALKDKIQEDFRCHAHANLGATNLEGLYLCDWEPS